MNRFEIRQNNLTKLIKKYGSRQALAAALDVAPSEIGNYFGKNSREMTDKKAIEYEEKLNLPIGYLDRSEDHLEPMDSQIVEIPVHEATLSAGLLNQEPVFDVLTDEKVFLTKEEITDLQVNIDRLHAFKVQGDSMQYTIPDQARVVVDRSQKDIIDNRVYAVTYGEELIARVKRLRKTAKGLLIISDNKTYEDELIEHGSGITINIIGRVVYVGTKL